MGTYFAKKGRFVAMAPVDRYGACPQKAPVGPRVASGPGVHASCHLARGAGPSPGHDPSRAATRAGKKRTKQICETKARNQL